MYVLTMPFTSSAQLGLLKCGASEQLEMHCRVDMFLSKHLGGRAEPLAQVENSSVVIMHEDAKL